MNRLEINNLKKGDKIKCIKDMTDYNITVHKSPYTLKQDDYGLYVFENHGLLNGGRAMYLKNLRDDEWACLSI